MRLLAALITAAVLILTPACALVTKPRTSIELDLKRAAATYADIRMLYAVLATNVRAGCERGAYPPPDCSLASELHGRARELDARIQRSLANPGVEPDYEAIREIVTIVLRLLVL